MRRPWSRSLASKPHLTVALAEEPRRHHDPGYCSARAWARLTPTCRHGLNRVSLVHMELSTSGRWGVLPAGGPHTSNVVEGHGGGDVLRCLGLRSHRHPDADVCGGW